MSSRSTVISIEDPPACGRYVLNHPHADIVLRSCDSQEFRVPKVYIIDNSTVLAESIRTPRAPSYPFYSNITVPADAATSLQVVQLSDSGSILSSLLSFIIPMTPDMPSTVEDTMELLSTAQKYEMNLVLTRIRDHVTRQSLPLIRDETAFHVYSLAQRYGLRQEANQAARFTLKASMSIEDLETTGKLDILSGALLHELWEYHQRVREYLEDDFTAFITLGAGARINFRCIKLNSSDVPVWLNAYIDSVARNPALFNLSEFHMALRRHVASSGDRSHRSCQSCASMNSKTIDTFWSAFSDVVQRSIENAEADLLLESEMESRRGHPDDSSTKVLPPQCLTRQNADVIMQSSDGVLFYLHKSILSLSSPFFGDMFSLPQPADDELLDGLPVVNLSEDAEVLHNLVTILYPIPSVIPEDYDKALALLAASQKYDMAAVQSSVRAEIKSKSLHPSTAAAAFRAYGFASAQGLTPETESTARFTLDFPMTFESMGDELSTLGGWALRDLARFRRRCRDRLISCLESLLDSRLPPSDIWVGCQNSPSGSFAWWLQLLLSQHIRKLRSTFTNGLLKPSSLRSEYLAALQSHVGQMGCAFCSKVHIMHGETFCVQVEKKLADALDEESLTSIAG